VFRIKNLKLNQQSNKKKNKLIIRKPISAADGQKRAMNALLSEFSGGII
jgi:hypothetical protein